MAKQLLALLASPPGGRTGPFDQQAAGLAGFFAYPAGAIFQFSVSILGGIHNNHSV